MAVDYSGLQQSQTMLEAAKLQEAGAASKGLEEGFEPLQKHLESIAEKKEKREDQLKLDQGKAIEYMQNMADTSGLLGQYEPIVTEMAKDVKFELNAIAQDESLNSFEKAAKYREVVQEFNKKASRFGREQELGTAFNEAFAKKSLSGAIDINSDDYKIAAGLAHGNYKVDKNGIYTITDDDGNEILTNIDSKRLKEIYLPLKTVDANEVSKTIGDIGKNAKNANQIVVNLKDLATEIGTIDAGKEFLIDGGFMDFEELDSELKGIEEKDQLTWLRNQIVEKGKGIANYVFLEKQPPTVPLSDAAIMGTDYYNILANAKKNNNWGALTNMDYLQGKITSAYEENGRLVLNLLDKSGRTYSTKDPALGIEGGGYNINDDSFLQTLGTALISNGEGTAKHLGEVQSTFIRLLNTPVTTRGGVSSIDEIDDEEIGYDEGYKFEVGGEVDFSSYSPEILNMSKEAIANPKMMKEAKGTAGGRSIVINSIFSDKPSISYEEHNERKERYESKYGEYNEQYLAMFKQDVEDISDQEKRSRVLEKNISNYASIAQGDKQVGEEYNNISELKKDFGLTDEEVEKLKGWKYKTFNELIKELHKITTGGKGNKRYLKAYRAGEIIRKENQKRLADKGLTIN